MTTRDLLAALKALADETRLRLARLLLVHELNVGELVAVLGMGQSRISRHLRVLVESGLLTARRDGLWVFYKADRQGRARELLRALAPLLDDAADGRDLDFAREALARRALETRHFFDSIAATWRDLRREVLGDLDLEGLIAARLPACRAAADLGCGPGGLLPVLAGKAERVIGVDSAPAMLELARRNADSPAVSLRVGELEHLPLADGEVQAAVMSLTLHHLPDPGAALAEARRVLAPGGTLVVVDFLKHSVESMRVRFGDRWLGFSPEEMSARLGQAGLVPAGVDVRSVNLGLELGLYVATRP